MSKYKLYYNEAFQKYGIKKLVTDYRGEHWTQILIKGNKEVAPYATGGGYIKCYTPYKGVALRWLKELKGAQL
jgi:hypothetical protein